MLGLVVVVVLGLVLVAALLLVSVGVAQEQPRYSCPEYDVDFEGYELNMIDNVASWEDCGKP